MEGVLKHWVMLPRALVESPFLEGFKIHTDVTLGDMGQWVDCWI